MNRKIDELGRIVIPKEIRKRLKVEPFDIFTIEVNDDKIILSKTKNSLMMFLENEIKYIRQQETLTEFQKGVLAAYESICQKMEG